MKKGFLQFAAIAITAAALFTGCSKDENNSSTGYGSGILVLNEGGFGSNNAEVSFINVDSSYTVENNIYGAANNGVLLGDVAQSFLVHNNKAYIVLNNSSKLEIVDLNTFEHEATISDLQMPRYMAIANNKLYLSEWVNFGVNGKVLVINLSTNQVEDSITVGIQPNQMAVSGDRLFVANSADTLITCINTSSNTVVGTVPTGDWPAYICADSEGDIWVLAGGVESWAGTPTSGKLVELNPGSLAIQKSMDFGSTSANPKLLTIDHHGTSLLYMFNGGVYKMSTGANALPSAPLITGFTYIYSLAIDPNNDNIFVGDAGNFTSNGTVSWYGSNGATISTATVGIAPTAFWFGQY